MHVERVSANVCVLVEARGQHYMPSQSLSTFCACACVCVHVCTCVWRPEFSIRSLPPLLSMLFFETGSHPEPGARMVTTKPHLAVFVPSSSAGFAYVHDHICLFMWVLGTPAWHSQGSSLYLSSLFVCLRLEPGPHTGEADTVALNPISSTFRCLTPPPNQWICARRDASPL